MIGNRVEPFFSLIRPGSQASPLEIGLLAVVLLLLSVGAWIAVRPILRKRSDRKRIFYVLNVLQI
jgi:hypothetical protein